MALLKAVAGVVEFQPFMVINHHSKGLFDKMSGSVIVCVLLMDMTIEVLIGLFLFYIVCFILLNLKLDRVSSYSSYTPSLTCGSMS